MLLGYSQKKFLLSSSVCKESLAARLWAIEYHVNPVVIMYSSDGVPFYDIVNDNAENTYLYFQAEDLVFSMKQMLLRQQYVDEFKQSPLYKKSLCKD